MSYKESDLVLEVSKNVDPAQWDEGNFQNFFDILFRRRNYQKEAAEIALRFMNSGEYQSISDLAKENFESNPIISERWNFNFNSMLNDIDLSSKLSATVDLATGTGKSYVMFGIALVMLATKKVERVLILAPSITIESELTKKFKELLTNNELIKSLGEDFIPPEIINGDSTLVENAIAIENRDAIYRAQASRNSIVDSLKGNGETTLVLNDEVHHVYYAEKNQWKSFIEDDENHNINFKYVIGFTGTPFKGAKNNAYFSNVIYRFSLRDAIDQGFVKEVEYISKEDIPSDKNERWQVILNSHNEIARTLPDKLGIKPITIVVTSSKALSDSKAKQFKEFLKESRNLNDSEVDKIVLSVHSGAKAKLDRMKLKKVDNKDNPVEFIFSVSMLTEGWDVKRVFQIVPDEERAFNSKLLIAQVLGRGLRWPNDWEAHIYGSPVVRVFNHEKWSTKVEALVNEILEIRKLIKLSVDETSRYNFDLYNVRYSAEKTTKDYEKMGSYSLWEKGVNLPTDDSVGESNITLKNVRNNKDRIFKAKYNHDTYTVDQMASILYHRFEDLEDDKEYIKEYQNYWPIERIKRMIEESLDKSGNKVITKSLKNKFLSSMSVISRRSSKVVTYKRTPDKFILINTKELPKSSNELSNFHKNKVLFYGDDLADILNNNNDLGSLTTFREIVDSTNGYKQKKIENAYLFKTPQIGIVTTGEPEKQFLEYLTDLEVSKSIDSFIKSEDFGFYAIDYTWKKGTHYKNGQFNPDWFIKQDNNIIVVETKDDTQLNDPDNENIGKNKSALEHFNYINKYLKEQGLDIHYKFIFLTPKDYKLFFDKLKNKEIMSYISNLDVKLAE